MLSQQKNKPPIKLIPHIGNITQKSYDSITMSTTSNKSTTPTTPTTSTTSNKSTTSTTSTTSTMSTASNKSTNSTNSTYGNFINHVGQQYGGQQYRQYNQQYSQSDFITVDHIQTPITSKDILLRNIHILDEIKPVLCERMYDILFCHDDENDNKMQESFINSKINEIIDYGTYFEENIKVLKLEKFIKILKISHSFNKYCTLFLNDDNIYESIIDKTLDLDTKYDISDKNNINTIISISKQDFLELSLETYPDDTAIIRQFIVDLPRQDVFINNIPIKDIDHLLFLLGQFNREVKINTKNRSSINTTMLSVALVCQSSFFMSFVHLLDKCRKMHTMTTLSTSTVSLSQLIPDQMSIISSEIQQTQQTLETIVTPILIAQTSAPVLSRSKSISIPNDPRLNMHVFDVKERDVISFIVTHDTYKCSFGAKYRIVDITTDTTLYNINTEILIDLDNDTGLIVYDVV